MDKKRNRKTSRHSTVSRRDFMKMLGLGSVGAGAAALGLSPVMPFADLDDMMSSEFSSRKLPFWIKEVDKPTVEIDYDQIERFPNVYKTLFLPEPYGGMEKFGARVQRHIGGTAKQILDGTVTIQDFALADCGAYEDVTSTVPWLGTDMPHNPNAMLVYGPEDLGVPRYSGTPEESSQMLRVAARIFGAFDVGFVKLDEKMKKFLYANVVFEDVDEGYASEDGRLILPDKDLWVITGAIPQSQFMSQYNMWGGAHAHAYSSASQYAAKMKTFLHGIGYQGYGQGHTDVGLAIPFGVHSGIAEYSRTGQMCSPILGTDFRTVILTITDLPLAPSKPIDAGIFKFCESCKKCAEECPGGAISMDDKPSWITRDTHNNPHQTTYGVKGYLIDPMKCVDQMYTGTTLCHTCSVVCPFNKFDKASLHQIINGVIGTTPVANKLIRSLDDVFGYGMKTAEESKAANLWEMDQWDVPLYGLDRV